MELITIATLNISAASDERAERILDQWVINSSFDVLVLTETSDGTGTDLIISEFKAANWCVFRRPTVTKDRGVVVVSRIPATEESRYFGVAEPSPGRSIVLQLQTSPAIELIAMYVPNRGNDPNKTSRKADFLDFWKRHLQRPHSSDEQHQLLVGDLNVVPPTQRPEFLPQYRFEDEWYQSLLHECGLYDAAVAHNNAGHESTWVAHTGEGYTYDHILPQKNLSTLVESFRYDHTTRGNDGVTDHSALLISLEVEQATFVHRNALTRQRQGQLF